MVSWHLPGGTEENNEKPVRMASHQGQNMNLEPPKYEAGALTTWLQRSVFTDLNSKT
jgi:hypothetical protein